MTDGGRPNGHAHRNIMAGYGKHHGNPGCHHLPAHPAFGPLGLLIHHPLQQIHCQKTDDDKEGDPSLRHSSLQCIVKQVQADNTDHRSGRKA